MDPNATLTAISAALIRKNYTEAQQLRTELWNWIKIGGFEPRWEDNLKATHYAHYGIANYLKYQR